MQALRDFLDKHAPKFHKGGPFEKYYAFYEANDTILFTPGEVRKGATHIKIMASGGVSSRAASSNPSGPGSRRSSPSRLRARPSSATTRAAPGSRSVTRSSSRATDPA